METCMMRFIVIPSTDSMCFGFPIVNFPYFDGDVPRLPSYDGCPWAFHTETGKTVFGGKFNPCSGTGCPRKTDPDYWSNQLYKYPICLHQYTNTALPVTTSTTSESSVPNITTISSFSTPEISDNWYIYKGVEDDPEFEIDTQDLENKLIEVYQNATECIPVMPLGSKTLPLSKFSSELVIVQESKHSEKNEQHIKRIKRQTIEKTDIFFNEEKPVKRIFMKGEAGRGKTVFSLKLLEEWCKTKQGKQGDMQTVLSQFKFIFHISMRYAHRTRVMDIICDGLSNGDPRLTQSIRYVLVNNTIRCLVVLDGLDEWSSNSDDFPDT